MNRMPLLAMLFFHLACEKRKQTFHDEREATMTDFDHRYLDDRPPPDEYL